MDLATYGYRGVLARLKIDGRQINHKRVYRVVRFEGCLLLGNVTSLWTSESMKAHWPLKKATRVGAPMDWICRAKTDNGQRVRVAFALDFCGREIMR